MIEKEPPIVTLFTMTRHAGAYAVVEVRMQGERVVERRVVDMSRDINAVWEAFKEAAAARFGRSVN